MATASERPSNALVSAGTVSYVRPLGLVTVFFLLWGFLIRLNDVFLPHLRLVFDLNDSHVTQVQCAFLFAYIIFSIPAARIVGRIGYQRTLLAGLLAVSAGTFLFIPAASVPSYPLFFTGLICLALGVTAVQVAANPYVVVVGEPASAASRLNLTHAAASLGALLAPAAGGLLILSAAPLNAGELRNLSAEALQFYRIAQAASVKMPYVLIGTALLLLALVISSFHLPDFASTRCTAMPRGGSIWRHRNLVLGAVAIFACIGAEVGIGSALGIYFTQPHAGGLTAKAAAGLVTVYWAGVMLGRFAGSMLVHRFNTRTLLAICTGGAAVMVATSILTTGTAAIASMLTVGVFSATVFPSIFALGLAELGPLTAYGSGVLSMGMAGGILIPVLQGVAGNYISTRLAFVLPVICYLYILHYALRGARPGRRSNE
jgi:FHS family L-fucose permease-like MFS transporter